MCLATLAPFLWPECLCDPTLTAHTTGLITRLSRPHPAVVQVSCSPWSLYSYAPPFRLQWALHSLSCWPMHPVTTRLDLHTLHEYFSPHQLLTCCCLQPSQLLEGGSVTLPHPQHYPFPCYSQLLYSRPHTVYKSFV